MQYKSKEKFKEEIYQYIGTTDTLILHSLSGISFPDPNYEMRRKNAALYSLEYIYSGEGVIQQNNEMYKVSAGDFFILHPGTYHHYYTNKENPWKKIFLTVDANPKFIDTLLKLHDIEKLVYLPKVYNPKRLEEIFGLLKSDSGNVHRKLENIVFNMISEISDAYKKLQYDSSKISVAKRFIDKRITTKIPITEVCEYVNLNISYFDRLFKKTYGISPTAYILQSKIEESKFLLKETNLSINDIANHYSFTDASHYIKSFIRLVGISPDQYRNQNNK